MHPKKTYQSFYSHTFNGFEKDDEIKGKGNSINFGARMYDSRLGRWLSVDKAFSKYPDFSTYCYVANSPILLIDVDGNIIGNPNDPDAKKMKAQLEKTEAGKLLWQAMVESPREIFIYIVPAEGTKNVNQERASELIAIDGELTVSKANGMVVTKKQFDEEAEYLTDVYTFDETTGNYTLAEDEPVVIIINEPGLIQQAGIEYAMESMSEMKDPNIDEEGVLDIPEYYIDVNWFYIGGEEAAHSLQNYYEPNLKWFNTVTQQYIELQNEDGYIIIPEEFGQDSETDIFTTKEYPSAWYKDPVTNSYDPEKYTSHEVEAKNKAQGMVDEYKSNNKNPVTGE